MPIDVGGFAVAGVLLVGAIAAQLLAGTADRRSRREEGTPMRKLYFVVSSIMVVVSNEMISVAPTVASGSSALRGADAGPTWDMHGTA
jgi:hypothetical protein